MDDAADPTPKVDGRRARGDRTRRTVLSEAVRIAAEVGLEGLTLGGVARAAGVPKSTLQMLFKDRETLQVATLAAGADAFGAGIRARVPPMLGAFDRLRALSEAWFDQIGEGDFPGGCLVTAAAAEYRGRPGAIQTVVATHRDRWRGALMTAARAAQGQGDLRADLDVDQLVFEILAFQGAANVCACACAGSGGAADLRRARDGVRTLLDRSRRQPKT